ncbi:uncharacterized protein PG986_007456 [Apiospora aurea]|uniref:Uncharacterized protein n=1 Tax=Apiospora aurea TaxID=335848 RepID=A0ABR1QCL8_9PEZI
MPPKLPSHQSLFRPAQYMPPASTKVELTPAQRHLLATSANLPQPALVGLQHLDDSGSGKPSHIRRPRLLPSFYTFIDAGPVAVFALRNQGRPPAWSILCDQDPRSWHPPQPGLAWPWTRLSG